jgi:hypothetical protein
VSGSQEVTTEFKTEVTTEFTTEATTDLVTYGLRFTGLDLDRGRDTGPPPAGIEHLGRVVLRHQPQGPELPRLDATRAVLSLPERRQLVADRRQSTAIFTGPALSPDELLHPYLGSVASIFHRWAGHEVYHAGAFVCDGLAWAIVGRREAGKSSLLAVLAARGWPVVADDLVITDGGVVWSGPRSVDLRMPVPASTTPLTLARQASRLRMSLTPAPTQIQLGGWIFLQWADQVSMPGVAAATLLPRLARQRTWQALATDPQVLLALSSLPAWDLHRPADWTRMDESVDLLLNTLCSRRVGGRIRATRPVTVRSPA